MSLEIYGLILLGGLFAAICLGFPISFTLITIGMIFGYIALGPKVFYLMTLSWYDTMVDTILAAVALFTFMGYILEKAGLMERLFHALLLLSGRLKGSLYLGTIFTATLFAAAELHDLMGRRVPLWVWPVADTTHADALAAALDEGAVVVDAAGALTLCDGVGLVIDGLSGLGGRPGRGAGQGGVRPAGRRRLWHPHPRTGGGGGSRG